MSTNEAAVSDHDAENAAFWNELCGTQFAKSLGVEDNSPASLKKFDDWYFAFYPYLFVHIPFEEMKGKDVLEIGLGYGTVSQRIAETGARYRGLDISPGPVAMANHRLRQNGLEGEARVGTILKAPFPDESFDFVVAIGCLHHTGDLQRAINECRRMLRPGGKLVLMVYYVYSYRRWIELPRQTLGYLGRELLGRRGGMGDGEAAGRAAYDANEAGEAAPHTDWISVRSLRSYSRRSPPSARRSRISTMDARSRTARPVVNCSKRSIRA